MTRITKADLKSLSYSICVLYEVKKNTVLPAACDVIDKHVHRLRKIQLLLVEAITQQTMTFPQSIQAGIDDKHSSHPFCSK